MYRVFRAQADWTFILQSEFPAKELRHLPRKIRRAAPLTEKSDKPAQRTPSTLLLNLFPIYSSANTNFKM
jgi:hypothetical protein